jgi:probable F420-dependent oxidoreductase
LRAHLVEEVLWRGVRVAFDRSRNAVAVKGAPGGACTEEDRTLKLDTQLGHRGLEGVVEEATSFERMGFDAGWTFEAGHDPFLPVVLAAAATKTLSLGTNIAVAFARSPMSMAQVAWDLQKHSKGRFHLGLGTQVRAHIERRYSMPYDHPVARLKDYVNTMRAIWTTFQTGAKPAYEGPFYRFVLMNPMFNPGPIDHPKIPIWLAGVNELMCKAAGEVADGFHIHPMHSVAYLKDVVIPKIDEGAKSRGRRASDIELYAPVFTVSGETQSDWDKSFAEVRHQISFYGSTPAYRPVLDHHGEADVAKQLSVHARQGEWDQMAKRISDELVEKIAVVAKPAELATAIKQRYTGLLSRVSLYFPIRAGEAEQSWKKFVAAFRAN